MIDEQMRLKHNEPETSKPDERNTQEIQEELSAVTGGLATISITGGDADRHLFGN